MESAGLTWLPPDAVAVDNAAVHELGILTQVVAALEEQLAGGARATGDGTAPGHDSDPCAGQALPSGQPTRRPRVTAVGMRVGALSGTSVEALHGAWPMASGGTIADGARLEVEELPAMIACPCCGEVEVDEFFALTCPQCGTPTGTVIHGYETEVAWADVERD